LNDLLIDPDRSAGHQPDGLHQTVQRLGFQQNSGSPKFNCGRQLARIRSAGNNQEEALVTGIPRRGYQIVSAFRTQI
jgi:hypothetical protein